MLQSHMHILCYMYQPTFIDINDVGMIKHGHELYFLSDSSHVFWILNLVLWNGLDCNLKDMTN